MHETKEGIKYILSPKKLLYAAKVQFILLP